MGLGLKDQVYSVSLTVLAILTTQKPSLHVTMRLEVGRDPYYLRAADLLSGPLLTSFPLFTSWLPEGWPGTCPPLITALPGAPTARARNEQGPVPPRHHQHDQLGIQEGSPVLGHLSSSALSCVRNSTKSTVTAAPHSLPTRSLSFSLSFCTQACLSVTEGIPRHPGDGPSPPSPHPSFHAPPALAPFLFFCCYWYAHPTCPRPQGTSLRVRNTLQSQRNPSNPCGRALSGLGCIKVRVTFQDSVRLEPKQILAGRESVLY